MFNGRWERFRSTRSFDGRGDASTQTTVRIDGDATLTGVGVLQFGGSAKRVLQIVGTDAAQAVLFVANGLTLQGLGTIDGSNFALVCDGTFEPRGAFALNGDFTLGADGRLLFGVSTLDDYSTLTVSGDATLYGTVELAKLRFDFVPTTLNSLKVLKAATLEVGEDVGYEGLVFGDFAEMYPEITSDSLVFTVGYVSGPKVVAVAPSDAASNVGEAVAKNAGIEMNSVVFVDEYGANREAALTQAARETEKLNAEIAAASAPNAARSVGGCGSGSVSYNYICNGAQSGDTPIGTRYPSNIPGCGGGVIWGYVGGGREGSIGGFVGGSPVGVASSCDSKPTDPNDGGPNEGGKGTPLINFDKSWEPGFPAQLALSKVAAIFSTRTVVNVQSITPSFSVSGGLESCSSSKCAAQSFAYWAKMGGKLDVTLFFGKSFTLMSGKFPGILASSEALGWEVGGEAGILFPLSLSVSGEYSKDCKGAARRSIPLGGSAGIGGGAEISGKAILKDRYNASVSGIANIATGVGVSATFSNSGASYSICWDGVKAELSAEGKLGVGVSEGAVFKIGGPCLLAPNACYPSGAKSNAVIANETDEYAYEPDEFYGFVDGPVENITSEDWEMESADFATADELAKYLGYGTKEKTAQELGITIANDVLSLPEVAEIVMRDEELRASRQTGVCATVKLQLKQSAVFQ